MAVAGVDIAPGVDDADHRLANPVGAVVARLLQARAMAERAQVVFAEPAIAAQVLGRFLLRFHSHTRCYSAVAPVALTTLAHLSVSSAMILPKSSGVPEILLPPS